MLDNKSQIWYNIGVNKTRKVTQMYCKRLSRNNCSRVDFFNENRIRNIQNTYLRSYNCGGYAFNTFLGIVHTQAIVVVNTIPLLNKVCLIPLITQLRLCLKSSKI